MPRRTQSTISANALLHFTRSKDILIGILQNEFLPRYALENQNIVEPEITNRHIAIPMVSFCDIPLSQVKDHVQHYGEYALGLTKEWARSQGIAPVLYAYPAALTSSAISNIFRNLPSTSDAQNFGGLAEAQRNLTYFSFYIKRYEGQMYRNGQYSAETVRFYNEREWRYVPPMNVLLRDDINAFLPKIVFDDPLQREDANNLVAQVARLGFQPKYIKYVIVKSETEILDIMDAILRIKGPNFPYDEVRKLTSRIISMEQVLEDF
jgi:hypothetical protein